MAATAVTRDRIGPLGNHMNIGGVARFGCQTDRPIGAATVAIATPPIAKVAYLSPMIAP
jgi:hypothetical protein